MYLPWYLHFQNSTMSTIQKYFIAGELLWTSWKCEWCHILIPTLPRGSLNISTSCWSSTLISTCINNENQCESFWQYRGEEGRHTLCDIRVTVSFTKVGGNISSFTYVRPYGVQTMHVGFGLMWYNTSERKVPLWVQASGQSLHEAKYLINWLDIQFHKYYLGVKQWIRKGRMPVAVNMFPVRREHLRRSIPRTQLQGLGLQCCKMSRPSHSYRDKKEYCWLLFDLSQIWEMLWQSAI